jgi:hypothetical protein
MREGGYYYSEKSCQLVPSMAHMRASRVWNDWWIFGHGSQEPVGRKYGCDHWILIMGRRKNEPIGAMNDPRPPHSPRRNDWPEFGCELLGA